MKIRIIRILYEFRRKYFNIEYLDKDKKPEIIEVKFCKWVEKNEN